MRTLVGFGAALKIILFDFLFALHPFFEFSGTAYTSSGQEGRGRVGRDERRTPKKAANKRQRQYVLRTVKQTTNNQQPDRRWAMG